MGKAVIRQGWCWGGAGCTPAVGGGSGRGLGAPREPEPGRGRAPGVRGLVPSGRVPPDPADLSELMLMKPVASAGS